MLLSRRGSSPTSGSAKLHSVLPIKTAADDRSAVARILAGDEAAARRFYDEHFSFVCSITTRYSEDADEASDMAQDAFVRIFASLGSFRGDSSIRTWMFRVSYGSALDHVRRRRSERRSLGRWYSSDLGESSQKGDPFLRARIANAVANLSEPLRDVFVMYEVHGLQHEEIAESLGIPAGTSKSRLSAARDQLRAKLLDVWEEQQG